ncbi:MAG: UDP-2,3-diacylglucosamine diphosphatase LpxI [Pseudomonadota bacterium]
MHTARRDLTAGAMADGDDRSQAVLPTGRCLGILAGSGSLPLEVADAVQRRGERVQIIGLRGVASDAIQSFPHGWTGLGQVGRMLRLMRAADCDRLLILGGLRRPNVWQLRPDLGFFRHIGTIATIMRGGDDAVLRRVIGFFERQGLTVVGVADVAPEVVASAGQIAGAGLGDAAMLAVQNASDLLDSTSRFDMGQAAIATPRGVIGIEDGGGTARLLASTPARSASDAKGKVSKDRHAKAADGAVRVLMKRAKVGQDMRVDMPAIGPQTVAEAVTAGVSVIASAGGEALIAERSATVAAADSAGIVIAGVDVNRPAVPRMTLGAEARALVAAVTHLGADAERALAITLTCAPHVDGPDVGTFVRRGHAMVCLARGLAERTWNARLADLHGPRSHWVKRRRHGTLAISIARAHMQDRNAQRIASLLTALARLHIAHLIVVHDEAPQPMLAMAGLEPGALDRQCAAADIRLVMLSRAAVKQPA